MQRETVDRRAVLESLYEEHRRLLSSWTAAGETLRPVFGEGPVGAAAMLVGEAPGAEETELGRPFVGRAGRVLNAFLEGAGLERGELYVTNAVKYRPYRLNERTGRKSNRTPGSREIALGRPLLLREVELLQPRVIVTLGNTPLRALGEAETVGALHGQRLSRLGRLLFPLYHPASILYNPALRQAYERDMLALRALLEEQRTGLNFDDFCGQ